jgi:hypothetical protein
MRQKFLQYALENVDFLRPESPRPVVSGFHRPEKVNSCDPVTRIRQSCGFLILHCNDGRPLLVHLQYFLLKGVNQIPILSARYVHKLNLMTSWDIFPLSCLACLLANGMYSHSTVLLTVFKGNVIKRLNSRRIVFKGKTAMQEKTTTASSNEI